MSSFWDWFIGDAGAAWIVGALSVLLTLYMWQKRERPAKVVVQVINKISLLNIHSAGVTKLHVFYEDEQGGMNRIQALEQTEIIIYNSGTRDITEPLEVNLRFRFKDKKGLWAILGDDAAKTMSMHYGAQDQYIDSKFSSPYLNSYFEHQQIYTIFLVAEYPMEVELLPSFGKGWSSYLVALEGMSQGEAKRKRLVRFLALGGAFISLLIGPLIFYNSILTAFDKRDALSLVLLAFGPFYLYAFVIIRLEKRIKYLAYSKYPGKEKTNV